MINISSRVWSAAALAAGSVLAISACASSPEAATAEPTPKYIAHKHAVTSGDPMPADPDAKFRSLAASGTVKGIVVGTAHLKGVFSMRSPVHPMFGATWGPSGPPDTSGLPETVYTEFELTVEKWRGRSGWFVEGDTIALRIPGGTLGDVQYEDDIAPIINDGDRVAVVVRDQGDFIGEVTPHKLLIAQMHGWDVFNLDASDTVKGQADWQSFRRPLNAFLALFA